ncbi:TPA: hypothetical protein L6B24_09680 [Pseudomonas aeruginosa]|nr:hypothetical protein B8A43_16320 [Pseudomonas aeruginosa]TEC47205.1 hypothetical protein IPC1592_12310 [Pseudomonas aeruginosa]TEN77904.1 hypothetical protein IPC135_14410 [Pseudomonas aeruginosa]TEN87232.1 hypothetical protein IPC133_12065 [Pseudomonas aeruginosa]HBP6795649.1 hypothetical protein [Pseudomonas aeruginosa]
MNWRKLLLNVLCLNSSIRSASSSTITLTTTGKFPERWRAAFMPPFPHAERRSASSRRNCARPPTHMLPEMKLYPIQLANIFVDEVHAVVHDRVAFEDKDYPRDFEYSLYSSEYNEEKSTISVKVEFEIKPSTDEIDRPFSMKIVVTGQFKVDAKVFPMKFLDDWATNNAPVVLIPYIRENAYTLSHRIGFEPIMLPMIEVPTVKIVAPQQPESD